MPRTQKASLKKKKTTNKQKQNKSNKKPLAPHAALHTYWQSDYPNCFSILSSHSQQKQHTENSFKKFSNK